MSDKPWIFDQVARRNEEVYFREREEELIAALRRKLQQQRVRQGLEEELDIYDERVLAALEELGLSREVLILLHIVPLVHVAWSDGEISPKERAKIFELAATRDIVAGTPAYARLESLLEQRPAEEGFEACYRVIRSMFSAWPPEQRRQIEANLPAYAAEVARVSGGVLGFGAVSADERAVLQKIAHELTAAHAEAAEEVAGRAVEDAPGKRPS